MVVILYASSPFQNETKAPNSIFDQIKFIDPINPNKVTTPVYKTGTIFDYYVPIETPKPDINENCYWDKKVLKEKKELEKSVERAKEKNRYEALVKNQEVIAEKIAVSSERRNISDTRETEIRIVISR